MKTLKNILKTKTFIVLIAMMTLIILTTGIFASSPAAFKDVPASYWGYKNIQRAYTDGVVSGTDYSEKTGERNFSPEAKLTMAQFTTILTRAFYADELAASTAGNEPDAKWYAATQDVCEKHDLTNGYNFVNAEYESGRYQMARIMYYVLVDKGITLPSDAEITAAQSKIADWNRIPERNKTSVATVFAMGLITGKDEAGNFVGNDSVTRAEAATVYCRLADVIAGEEIAVEALKSENDKHAEASSIDFTERIVALVNEARVQNNLCAVSLDVELSQAAQARANECVQKFSHTRPDGTKCFTVLGEMGISYSYAAENIAYGQKSADEVMKDWLNSAGHRANILNTHVTKVGIGYIDVDGRIYWVQIFKD